MNRVLTDVSNLVVTLILCISLSACAANYGAVTINSTPSGAAVVLDSDGSLIGYTPLTRHWKQSNDNRQHIIVRLSKDGYQDKVTSFWVSMRHGNKKSAFESPDVVNIPMQKKGT